MMIKVNCIYNNKGAWCNNLNINKSLFGLGARCCSEYPNSSELCPHQEKVRKPSSPSPSPPLKRKKV